VLYGVIGGGDMIGSNLQKRQKILHNRYLDRQRHEAPEKCDVETSIRE
jgi:hypothetical protein